MTKKQRFWKIIAIVITSTITLATAWSVSLMFYNPFLAPTMVEFYSNDSNFRTYEAVVKDCAAEPAGILTIKSIIMKGEEKQVKGINYLYARVFSSNIEDTWRCFAPHIGLKFEFVGTLAVFFDGCPAAIISITVRGEQILLYEEGKKALLEWASQVH